MNNRCINFYRTCREFAGLTQEQASERLNISVRSLANYESGYTIPNDIVVRMSEVYNAPELKNFYCKSECPIGWNRPVPVQMSGIAVSTIRMLRVLDAQRAEYIKNLLLEIAEDGIISEEEKPDLKRVEEYLNELISVAEEIRLECEKAQLDKNPHNM